jgi:hypothetical protein
MPDDVLEGLKKEENPLGRIGQVCLSFCSSSLLLTVCCSLGWLAGWLAARAGLGRCRSGRR